MLTAAQNPKPYILMYTAKLVQSSVFEDMKMTESHHQVTGQRPEYFRQTSEYVRIELIYIKNGAVPHGHKQMSHPHESASLRASNGLP